MNAGRALDALVAERVMGDKVLGEVHGEGDYWQENGTGDLRGSIPVPSYSTDIAAAWLVVEKMVSDKRLIRVQYNGRCWFCTLTAIGDVLPIIDWDGDTAPLAICLAALKAVGVNVEETA